MPEELFIALECQKWHALPVSGGLLEQPSFLMTAMNIALDEFNSAKAESDIDNAVKDIAASIIDKTIAEKLT